MSGYISFGSLFVSLAGVIVAIVALVKTNQAVEGQRKATAAAESLEREAIIVIQTEWEGRREIDAAAITGIGQPQPELPNPEKRLVIQGTPTVADGLVLRPANPADDADRDGPANRSYRFLLEIQNYGRWSVTQLKINCTLYGHYLPVRGRGGGEQTYLDQEIAIDALAPNTPFYVEVRNVTGTPASLEFISVSTVGDQGIRLVPSPRLEFWARG